MGTGHTGNSLTVKPKTRTSYGVRCLGNSGCAINLAEKVIEVDGIMPDITKTAAPGTFINKGKP